MDAKDMFFLFQDALGKKVEAVHLDRGHVIRPRAIHDLDAEGHELVKLLGEKRIAHSYFCRSRIMVILRDNLWPADSSRTFISPSAVGGKGKAEFHNERMEIAVGERKLI